MGSHDNLIFTNERYRPYKPLPLKVNNANGERKHRVLAKIDLNKGERKLNYRNSVQMNTFIDRRVHTEIFYNRLRKSIKCVISLHIN